MNDKIQSEWDKLVKESRAAPGTPPPPADAPFIHAERKKKLSWILPALFLASLIALAGYLQGSLSPWPAAPTDEELAAGRRARQMQVLKSLHDYAAFHGKYPTRIEEVVGGVVVDIHYERTPTGFRLSMPGQDGKDVVIEGP